MDMFFGKDHYHCIKSLTDYKVEDVKPSCWNNGHKTDLFCVVL